MSEEPIKASEIINKSLSSHLVEGEDTLQYDLGNLCAFDYSSINKNEYKSNPQLYLNELSRNNVQLLISRLFQLPIKSIEEGSLALLPACLTKIPRERSVPQGKVKTRWEAFAELKGIKKQKKSKMAWDEKHQEYRPSYGYNKANDDSGEFIMEGKSTDKVGEDPFQKKQEEKNERVQKQKKREQRNFDEASMRQMGNVGKSLNFSQEHRGQIKSDMEKVFDVAKLSTASMGRFDKKVENEKNKTKRGNKKLAGLGADNVQKETESATKMVDRMLNKENVLNVDKAVRQEIKSQERENYTKKRKDAKENGGSKKKFKK